MSSFARRAGRWVARLALALTLLVLVALVALVVASRTTTVRELVRARLVSLLTGLSDARVQIGALEGTLGRSLVLHDVRLAVEGRTIARVSRLEVVYALLPLLRRELRLERVVVEAPRVRAIRSANGWLLPHGRGGEKESEEREEGGEAALAVVVRRVTVADGRVAVALLDGERPRRFAATGMTLEGSVRFTGGRARIDLAALHVVPRGVALSPIDASGGVGAESDGTVRVSDLVLASARSRIGASGVVARGRRVDAEVRLAPLAAADVRAIVPSSRVAADLRARARARGPWRAIASVLRAEARPGGTVTARATLDAGAEPLRYDFRAAVAALDPGAAVADLPRAEIGGRLALSGEGFDLHGPLAYRVDLADSRFADRQVDRLVLAGEGRAGVHRLRGEVGAPVGDVTMRARVALSDPPAYRLAARYTLARLDLLTPSAWGWATGRLGVRGRGTDPEDRRARALLTLTSGSLEGVRLDRGRASARLAGERLALRSLALEGRDVGLRLDASGSLDLERRSTTFALRASADAGAIGGYLGRPLAGKASVTASARGPLTALAAEATATAEAPAYDTASAERATARLDLRQLGGAAPSGELRVDATKLRVRAGTPYATRAEVAWRRSGREDRADLTLQASGEDGRRQEVAGNLVRGPDRTRGELRTALVTPPEGGSWKLVRPTGFVLDQGIAVDGLELAAGEQRVALAGRIGLRDRCDASLTLERVALAPVCVLTALPPCDGELSSRVALTGTAAAPVVQLDARAIDLRVSNVAYGVLELDARHAETTTRLHGSLRHPQAGEVRVEGTVPLDLAWAGPRRDLGGAPVALTARADHLDLTIVRAFAPRTLVSSAGRLSLELAVSGPRSAPRLDGEAAIDDGAVELAAAGIPYEGIRARLGAHGTSVEVRELSARAGDGKVEAHGNAVLARGGATTLDIAARFDQFFAVRREAYEAALSGDLAVRGSLGAPDVSGALQIDRAVVRPATGLPGSGPTVARDETITVVGVRQAEAPTRVPETEITGPLKLGLTVEVKRNAWIRRTDANIEIAGDLKISKAENEPVRIVGQIRLLRGWYAFQGRRFTLEEGTITFVGATPPEPTFDITAIYRIHEYRIEVRITGSSKKPNLAFSSDPTLEQADVLSVILFGKPAHELGRGQSAALQDKALQLAAGYVMPELRASVMDALGLDTLEVQMPERSEAGRVSAGRYVAEDVFLSLGQEFGRRSGQVAGVEYSLGANVSIRASTSTEGNSALDLFWHYRY